MSADFTTQRDNIKPPQYVTEGTTAATYGMTPNNPVFTQALKDATISDSSTPTTVDVRIAGKAYNRVEKKKVREVNTLTLKGYLREADKNLLKLAANETGDNNIDTSFTLLQSRRDTSGTEQYYLYKGCKIGTLSLSIDNNGQIMADFSIRFKNREVTSTTPNNTAGAIKDTDTGEILTHLDVGFVYNGASVSHRTATITVTWESAIHDAAGSLQDLYCKAARGLVSGSFDLFSRGDAIQAEALAVTARSAIVTISTITLTFTGFVFDPSAEEVKGDSADATIESKSFEANSVVVS